MASSNTNIQWQPSPVVQALQDAIKYPRTSPSWFDILYPRKEERLPPESKTDEQQQQQQQQQQQAQADPAVQVGEKLKSGNPA
jgi:hypothetical protein